jgi:hypothetical protein
MIPPETTSEAIKTASTTLEQVALLDKDFPDIGDSFAGKVNPFFFSFELINSFVNVM